MQRVPGGREGDTRTHREREGERDRGEREAKDGEGEWVLEGGKGGRRELMYVYNGFDVTCSKYTDKTQIYHVN